MSALLVVIGLVAIAMFFAFLIVPGLRYQANTSDETTVVAVQGENGWLEPTDYLPAKKREMPPIDPKTVMTASPELLARGKTLFTQTCASCHGPEGRGDGPGGKGLNPPPRNFTANAGWKNGSRIEDIFRTLDDGVKGSAMASYNYLSKKDRMSLVHHVQRLGAFDHAKSDPQARVALEKLFSSLGEVIPNRIPVRDATQRLVHEFSPPRPFDSCEKALSPSGSVVDPVRAAQTIAGICADSRNDAAFARDIALGAPNNGFAVKVDTFTPAQWNQLRLCLFPHGR